MTTDQQPAPPMKYRKLRIAWSVGWGLIAVLLCVLWVRSYDWYDSMSGDVLARTEGESEVATSVIINSWGGVVLLHTSVNSLVVRPLYKYWRLDSTYHAGFLWEDTWSFARRPSWRHVRVTMPHWFLVLIATSFGALPWLPWWSNRFSLRTLLLATTLVAVVLGSVAWAVRTDTLATLGLWLVTFAVFGFIVYLLILAYEKFIREK